MEIWKDILGYEGLYQVSNMGRVKSIERVIVYSNGNSVKYPERILSYRVRKKDGYVTVTLCKNQMEQTPYVHRLVAVHFILNPNNKPEINHKKGDKKDNRASELEWATESENNKHAHVIGLNSSLKGQASFFSKLKDSDIFKIRELYKNGMLSQKEIASKFGVTTNNVWHIVNNKTWAHI